MKKKIVLVVSVVLALAALAAGGYLLAKKGSDGWKKVYLGDDYYKTAVVELDLDGDGKKEKVDINESGKCISIDGVDYVANKYLDENSGTFLGMRREYDVNQYHIVDLNGDGVLEIIHRTFSNMISPITSKYTIYNFVGDNLKEVGDVSFVGNMPSEVYVKGNKVKFEYWPYESPEDYTEEVVLEQPEPPS